MNFTIKKNLKLNKQMNLDCYIIKSIKLNKLKNIK